SGRGGRMDGHRSEAESVHVGQRRRVAVRPDGVRQRIRQLLQYPEEYVRIRCRLPGTRTATGIRAPGRGIGAGAGHDVHRGSGADGDRVVITAAAVFQVGEEMWGPEQGPNLKAALA